MDLELANKRAVVVGGSRGIGRAVALQLAMEGAHVAIGARDRGHLEAAAAAIGATTGRAVLPVALDTLVQPSVVAMAETVAAELGGIDILINCAAGGAGEVNARFPDVGAEAMLGAMDSKALGYLRCAQAVAPYMIAAGWGRIISLSGLGARRAGSIVGTIRNVSVVALMKNLADELAPHHINVTVVHPGATRTEKTTDATRGVPNLLGRMPDAAEVAYVVAFLASPRSVAINGEVVGAGGGMPGAIAY